LPEASGLALSRRTPGTVWSITDSGQPLLYALSIDGAFKGTVRVKGAYVHDWEAIATARCTQGNCLYIADIGDNDRSRKSITVYRVPEPGTDWASTADAEQFRGTYPDGPHDAEALFITAAGGVFVVTKDKPAILYRFPEAMDPGTTMSLQQVGILPVDRVTDATTSTDDRWVAIRTHDELVFYPSQDLTAGLAERGAPIDLSGIGEPQGEGVAMASDGILYLAGEGGEEGRPGTFASLRCRLPTLD
jgi:hypothetical protein